MATPLTSPPGDTPIIVRDRRRKPFFMLDNELVDRFAEKLKPHGLAVYVILARFANQDGTCWPSLSTIARRTSMSRRQAIREITRLQALGLIAIDAQIDAKTKEHKTNIYTLLDIPGGDTGSPGSDSQSLGGGDSQSLGSDSQSPKQNTQNKTYHRNKTQRTTLAAPIVNNNNTGGQSPSTPVVVASHSLTQESAATVPQTNTEREDLSASSSVQESPIPPVPDAPPFPPDEAKQEAEQELITLGISQRVAHRLAIHYSAERIVEKIVYLRFLQEESPETVKNPRGWLRRAIEENYGPPDGFITVAEQARLEAEAAKEAQRAAAAEQSHQAFAAQLQARREARRRQLQEQYGTTEEDYQLWAEVLTTFKYGQPDLYYLYERAQILRSTDEAVLLGFEHEGLRRKLEHPGILKALQRQLQLIAKRPLEVETVLLSVEAMGDLEEDGTG